MKFKQSDYKGKYFILQDTIDYNDPYDFEVGEMDEKDLTDEFLKAHVKNCRYYGIPDYLGANKKLHERLSKCQKEYDIEHSLTHEKIKNPCTVHYKITKRR